MKEYLIMMIALATITSPGCGPSAEEKAAIRKTKGVTFGYFDLPKGISVQTIDSCEYIYCEVTYGVSITHKQNCRYCNKRQNK